jgi:peroxiredoxin
LVLTGATVLVLLLLGVLLVARLMRRPGARASSRLVRGQRIPDFRVYTEDGESVGPSELHGLPAVIIFLRGNWCPFCSSQVEELARHYREISELGARLIFVVPKPQETTRRVADHFGVDFTFWLDPDLSAARRLHILDERGVPEEHREVYGSDTLRPVSVVVDREGIIRYAYQSEDIRERPDPENFIKVLEHVD